MSKDVNKGILIKYFKYLDGLRQSPDDSIYQMSLRLQEDWGLNRGESQTVLRCWVISHDVNKTLDERVDSILDILTKYQTTNQN